MKIQIKGEYEINILIQNMFNSYEITTRNTNIVTNEGLNLILQILGNKTTKRLGEVHVGTNPTEPSILDTISSFSYPQAIPGSIDVESNTLIYNIKTDGSYIDGTREIGIWSDDNRVLITRDVHDTYDVPTSAIITVKYSLILSNKTETVEEAVEESEEEINDND